MYTPPHGFKHQLNELWNSILCALLFTLLLSIPAGLLMFLETCVGQSPL